MRIEYLHTYWIEKDSIHGFYKEEYLHQVWIRIFIWALATVWIKKNIHDYVMIDKMIHQVWIRYCTLDDKLLLWTIELEFGWDKLIGHINDRTYEWGYRMIK